MNNKPKQVLSAAQAQALFEILTQSEVHREIEQYKFPDPILSYGVPFQSEQPDTPSTPLLQSLLVRLGLKVPGLKDVSEDFWKIRCKSIFQQFGEANLSESYDRGLLTRRRTLATACATILAPLVRGVLGGISPKIAEEKSREYDLTNSEDLEAAWESFTQAIVHDDLLNEIIDKSAKTSQLNDHSPLVQAAHEYILVNIASFLHQTFIRSPDGQSLLRLIESVHRLTPYTLIRQTLKLSNAATMIYGMTKLLLSKLSIGSLTNWIGLSNGASEGMNLMQHIVSTIYLWEIRELQKRVQKIEKSNDSPGKSHLNAIKEHGHESRTSQERRRRRSMAESKSLITVILEDSQVKSKLSEKEHKTCLDYLNMQLCVRDREVLSNILCRQQPDHLTQGIYDLVAAYDPIIRSIHNVVDLSASLIDTENFITDFLKCAKVESNSAVAQDNFGINLPTIEDLVALLRKHAVSTQRYLHLVAKGCKGVTEQYRSYLNEVASEFRCAEGRSDACNGAGNVTEMLNEIVSNLSTEDRQHVLEKLDDHARYLAEVSACSSARLHSILSGANATLEPPGIYPARWQSLLDDIPITPDTTNGPIRYGRDSNVRAAARVDVDGVTKGSTVISVEGDRNLPQLPDSRLVVGLLSATFRKNVSKVAML